VAAGHGQYVRGSSQQRATCHTPRPVLTTQLQFPVAQSVPHSRQPCTAEWRRTERLLMLQFGQLCCHSGNLLLLPCAHRDHETQVLELRIQQVACTEALHHLPALHFGPNASHCNITAHLAPAVAAAPSPLLLPLQLLLLPPKTAARPPWLLHCPGLIPQGQRPHSVAAWNPPLGCSQA